MTGLKLAATAATAIAVMVGPGAVAGEAASAPLAASAPFAASASCAGAIRWDKAARYRGRTATVRGRVAGTRYAFSSDGAPTFLNLGVDYPNSRRFTVVIWGRNRSNFETPERRYRGRVICVRGLVRAYRGLPQIHASSRSQIAFA
jgi:hypothetical protein